MPNKVDTFQKLWPYSRAMNENNYQGLTSHIKRKKSSKTVCVSNVLAYIGVPLTAYQVTSTKKNVRAYQGVLRRNGFAVRSRKSSIPKNASVGKSRASIVKIAKGDPAGTHYMVMVRGHLLLLNGKGETIVDTDPRVRDGRKIIDIHAVWPA